MPAKSRSLHYMVLVSIASAALFYLLREHWGHLFGMLPYLLFLACPLMHFFMHGSHRPRDYRDQFPADNSM